MDDEDVCVSLSSPSSKGVFHYSDDDTLCNLDHETHIIGRRNSIGPPEQSPNGPRIRLPSLLIPTSNADVRPVEWLYTAAQGYLDGTFSQRPRLQRSLDHLTLAFSSALNIGTSRVLLYDTPTKDYLHVSTLHSIVDDAQNSAFHPISQSKRMVWSNANIKRRTMRIIHFPTKWFDSEIDLISSLNTRLSAILEKELAREKDSDIISRTSKRLIARQPVTPTNSNAALQHCIVGPQASDASLLYHRTIPTSMNTDLNAQMEFMRAKLSQLKEAYVVPLIHLVGIEKFLGSNDVFEMTDEDRRQKRIQKLLYSLTDMVNDEGLDFILLMQSSTIDAHDLFERRIRSRVEVLSLSSNEPDDRVQSTLLHQFIVDACQNIKRRKMQEFKKNNCDPVSESLWSDTIDIVEEYIQDFFSQNENKNSLKLHVVQGDQPGVLKRLVHLFAKMKSIPLEICQKHYLDSGTTQLSDGAVIHRILANLDQRWLVFPDGCQIPTVGRPTLFGSAAFFNITLPLNRPSHFWEWLLTRSRDISEPHQAPQAVRKRTRPPSSTSHLDQLDDMGSSIAPASITNDFLGPLRSTQREKRRKEEEKVGSRILSNSLPQSPSLEDTSNSYFGRNVTTGNALMCCHRSWVFKPAGQYDHLLSTSRTGRNLRKIHDKILSTLKSTADMSTGGGCWSLYPLLQDLSEKQFRVEGHSQFTYSDMRLELNQKLLWALAELLHHGHLRGSEVHSSEGTYLDHLLSLDRTGDSIAQASLATIKSHSYSQSFLQSIMVGGRLQLNALEITRRVPILQLPRI